MLIVETRMPTRVQEYINFSEVVLDADGGFETAFIFNHSATALGGSEANPVIVIFRYAHASEEMLRALEIWRCAAAMKPVFGAVRSTSACFLCLPHGKRLSLHHS